MTTGIILSGGKSSRMGMNKAFLAINGELLIDRTVRIFKGMFKDVIIVTNSPLDYKDQDVRIVTDIIKGKGALGGIYTGLFFASSTRSFVAACDMPFLEMPFIRHMTVMSVQSDIIVPETATGLQPLHAVYSKKCLPEMERLMKDDRLKVTGLYEKFRVMKIPEETIRTFQPDLKMFLNINSPEDMDNMP